MKINPPHIIDSFNDKKVAFKIKVIYKDIKEKLKIELLGENTGDSKKLEPLKELNYSYWNYIPINPIYSGLV